MNFIDKFLVNFIGDSEVVKKLIEKEKLLNTKYQLFGKFDNDEEFKVFNTIIPYNGYFAIRFDSNEESQISFTNPENSKIFKIYIKKIE